jgi:quinol monooxygenase YgiN/mannose-6-phosphate isomerase-like protein (cupin superfamily)
MSAVGRYAKAVAKPGKGDELAHKLLEVARALKEAPGCQLYVINRSADDRDVVWVTELWQSQEQLDAAGETPEARERIPEILALVGDGGFERVDLEPLGGVGYQPGETGFAIVNLEELEDLAPKAGFQEVGEARFARQPLGAVGLGVSLQRLRPGKRSAFAHRHGVDEEVYVVLQGSGRVALDDQVREVRRLDTIRVAPGSLRVFEAGPDGLEFLAIGSHHAGDAQMVPGFWPEETAQSHWRADEDATPSSPSIPLVAPCDV